MGSNTSAEHNQKQGHLQVNMLGNLTITEVVKGNAEDRNPEITANLTGRAHRLWLLIAYLIVNRNRGVSTQELIDLLWPEATGSNPSSKLQNNVSRARALFSDAGFEDPRELIKYVDGLYYWAPDMTTTLDVDEFEQRAQKISEHLSTSNPEAIQFALDTALMYKGDFLSAITDISWCTNLAVYYRLIYMRVCKATVEALLEEDRLEEARKLCVHVTEIDPAAEEFSVLLMEALILDGQPAAALEHYQTVANYLSENYDVRPCPELETQREIALQEIYGRGMTDESIRNFLYSADEEDGAFECSNAIFREIVLLRQREMARTGSDSYIIAINIDHKALKNDRRVINIKRVTQALSKALRSSDPFTKVGTDQFLVLLPGANEENSRMVFDRIVSHFKQEFPQADIAFKMSLVSLADL